MAAIATIAVGASYWRGFTTTAWVSGVVVYHFRTSFLTGDTFEALAHTFSTALLLCVHREDGPVPLSYTQICRLPHRRAEPSQMSSASAIAMASNDSTNHIFGTIVGINIPSKIIHLLSFNNRRSIAYDLEDDHFARLLYYYQ